ncbi:MAG: glycosyltransferase [Candidatus Limnocylindria bacterium]
MSRMRVAFVVHATYPQEPRVRLQAEALAAAGHEVDVFALRETGQAPTEEHGGIAVHRLPVERRWPGMVGHLAEYAAFGAIASVVLARQHARRRYRLVQVANPPDFLVLAALPVKLAGVPVLLDLHEDMPMFYRDRFGEPAQRFLSGLVTVVAKASAAVADELLTVHEPLRALAIERGVAPERIGVVMNSANEAVFDPDRARRRVFMEDGQLRLIHHSNLQRMYGLDVAIAAVAELDDLRARLDVYGDGPFRADLEAAIDRAGVGDRVRLHGAVPSQRLPQLIADADIGLVPTRPEPYAHYSLSTKLLEYAAMGVPIIASDLATFRAHFDEHAISYVPGGDPSALAAAIRADVGDPAATIARGEEARRQSAAYAWSGEARRYVAIVERLARQPARTASARTASASPADKTPQS